MVAAVPPQIFLTSSFSGALQNSTLAEKNYIVLKMIESWTLEMQFAKGGHF